MTAHPIVPSYRFKNALYNFNVVILFQLLALYREIMVSAIGLVYVQFYYCYIKVFNAQHQQMHLGYTKIQSYVTPTRFSINFAILRELYTKI